MKSSRSSMRRSSADENVLFLNDTLLPRNLGIAVVRLQLVGDDVVEPEPSTGEELLHDFVRRYHTLAQALVADNEGESASGTQPSTEPFDGVSHVVEELHHHANATLLR